jgi:hypothetical protein
MPTEINRNLPYQAQFAQITWRDWRAATTSENIAEFVRWRGYSLPFCQRLVEDGLLVLPRLRGQIRVALPIHDQAGEVVGVHHRPVGGDAQWLVSGGCRMFPLLIGNASAAQRMMVFESQWDAFALMDRLGWREGRLSDTLVLSTRGAANCRVVDGRVPSGAPFVHAFSQNDPAGARWLTGIARFAGKPVANVVTPSQFKDLNEWALAGATGDEILAAIQSAQPVVAQEASGASRPSERLAYGQSHELNEERDLDADRSRAADPRALVRLPGDNWLLSEFAHDLGSAIAPHDIYVRGGMVVIPDIGKGALRVMNPEYFRTWIERHVVPYKLKEGDSGSIKVRRSLAQMDASAVLSSEHFQRHLREIKRVNLVPLPVKRADGTIELLLEGYDPASGVLTLPSGLTYDLGMSLEDARRELDTLLEEFCFADEGRSKAVALAGLLTLVGLSLMPEGILLPVIIVLANAEGAGKTLLIKAIVVPVLGECVIGTKPTNEEEMRKLLLAAVMEARPVLVLDNVREHLSSAALEAFVTTTVWSDRVLGVSKTFKGEKRTLVYITGNACTLTPDMRRRSLFAELFMREERAEERKFRRRLEVGEILAVRTRILSAAYALIRHWDAAGRPGCTKSHSAFPQWTDTIGAIVETAGYACPVETPQIEAAGDTDGEAMRALVVALAAGAVLRTVDFSELVETAREAGAFDRILGPDGDLDRSQTTKFARILKRYDRRFIGDYLFRLEGKGHARRYTVEFAAPPEPAPQTDAIADGHEPF